MPNLPTEGIRRAVLAGRFLGNAPATVALAALVATGQKRDRLALWFGSAALVLMAGSGAGAATLRAALDRDIAALDVMISAQVDAVLRHPRVRRLEGSWRGLFWLIERLPRVGAKVRVKLLQARWTEVCRDIERALEFDQSQLFRKIHEEQFGTAGGEPFGLIAGDYEVRHRPSADHPTDDVGVISGLAGIAAASFAPMIVAASPELLGLNSFADMTPGFDPAAVLQSAEYQRWRKSSAQEDLRFIGVALPRVLGRTPWVDDGSRADCFRYRQYSPGPIERVWTSPVYGFAAVAIRAFDRFSWPADVRGAGIAEEAGGGVLDDLPIEHFYSDIAGAAPARTPLEVAFTDEQENRISDAGLIPLAALDGLAEACFGALPSLHRPPRMATAVAEANQRMSSQLNTLLCVSRFAHCVKLMGRDMTGSFLDPSEVQERLQQWLNGFIGGTGLATLDSTARYPLQDAQVEVRERRGSPGVYNCTVHLKPHHQLDEVGASFRLVTEFSQRNANASP
jgi:type VI secretion system protein ImpD/type VI secretion system protein ImpC